MPDSLQLSRIAKRIRAISDFTLQETPKFPDWFTRQFKLEEYEAGWNRWRQNSQISIRDALSATKELNDLILFGTGSPEGRISASPGKIYLNIEGGEDETLWIKETGNTETGWSAK